jgi:hypothetical protein
LVGRPDAAALLLLLAVSTTRRFLLMSLGSNFNRTAKKTTCDVNEIKPRAYFFQIANRFWRVGPPKKKKPKDYYYNTTTPKY